MIQFTWYVDPPEAVSRVPNAKRFAQRAIEQAEKRGNRYVSKHVADGDTKFSVLATKVGRQWYAHVRIETPTGDDAAWLTTYTFISGTTYRLLTQVYGFDGEVAKTLRDIEYSTADLPESAIPQGGGKPGSFVSADGSRYFEHSSDSVDHSLQPYVMRLLSGNEVLATYTSSFALDFAQSLSGYTHFTNDGTSAVIVFLGVASRTPIIVRLSITQVDGVWQITEEFRIQFSVFGDAMPGHVNPFFFEVMDTATGSLKGVSSSEFIAADMRSILLVASGGDSGFDNGVMSVSLETGAIALVFQQYDFNTYTPDWDFFLDIPVWDIFYTKSGDVYAVAAYSDLTSNHRFSLVKNGVLVWNPTVGVFAGGDIRIYQHGRMNTSDDGKKFSFVTQTRTFVPGLHRQIDYFQYREGESNIAYAGTPIAVSGTINHQGRIVISADGDTAIIRGLGGVEAIDIGYMVDGAFEIVPMTGDAYPFSRGPNIDFGSSYPLSRKWNEDFFFHQPYQNLRISPNAGQSKVVRSEDAEGVVSFTYTGLPASPETPIVMTGYLGHQNFSH